MKLLLLTILLSLSLSASAQCYLIRNQYTDEISRVSLTDSIYTKIVGTDTLRYLVWRLNHDSIPSLHCLASFYHINNENLKTVGKYDYYVDELYKDDIFKPNYIIYNLDYLTQEVVIPVVEIDPEAPFTQCRAYRTEAVIPDSK